MNDNMDKKDTIAEDENEHTFHTIEARPVELRSGYDYFGRKWYFKVFTPILVFLLKIFVRYLYAPLFLGFRVKNKKILKKHRNQAKIFIGNHIHPTDAFLIGTVIWPKKVYFLMLYTNLGIPFLGKWLRFLGGAPIPTKRSHLIEFQEQLNDALARGAWVGVYPESSLRPYCDHIRPFKKGAIRFAVDANVGIIPMVFVLRKPYGLYRLFKRKPLLQLHVLEEYIVDDKGTRFETIDFHTQNLHNILSEYFEKHSNIMR
ncbi:MAG: lysophospholipid acyltransferase family protein [Acholeplasmataceae bacterium]|nr:lysophospholipid acyltransferase family protein [Acholeplasmataceae bacterium]